MSPEEYFRQFADHVSRQFVPSDEIKPFVGSNSNLIGGFAEAQVRKFVRRMVAPLRVSHGAVIAPMSTENQTAKQVDTIIWTPNPLPALYEAEDFALIPWASSMGVLEIKSSAYSGAIDQISNVVEMEDQLTCGRVPADTRGIRASLGVVILNRDTETNSQASSLNESDRTIVLLNRQEDGSYQPNTDSVYRLINFLAEIRSRAEQLTGLRVDPRNYSFLSDNSSTAI